ncbi:MAG: hypothetical protein FJ125_02265 [Deltaproteobacteria bacterium]|nr:hypothetical protein [Deltaproteobacteria bacterium]
MCKDRPWFIWDMDVSDAELRVLLRQEDLDARAQWQARVLREALFLEVWSYLSLTEILDNWPHIRRHLGRRRKFWDFILQGWRDDGLLPVR